MTEKATKEGYMKLFRTAYELAMNPTISLSQCCTLVKVQRKNGVRLIDGHDSATAAKEFIHYIAAAISEKVAAVVASFHFISILTDGSQARKTKSEKKMVLIRTYIHKVVGCTSDGASINFGHVSGLMKRMPNNRDWLIKFHCVNHRVELAVKDAIKTSEFKVVDKLYIEIFNLLKNSARIW